MALRLHHHLSRLRQRTRRLRRDLARLASTLLLLLLAEVRSLAVTGLLWSLMIAVGSSLIAYAYASPTSSYLHPHALALSFGVGMVVFGGLSLAHGWRRDQTSR